MIQNADRYILAIRLNGKRGWYVYVRNDFRAHVHTYKLGMMYMLFELFVLMVSWCKHFSKFLNSTLKYVLFAMC